MTRMVRWIDKNIDVESKIIDLGCGNGLMSIELYEVAGLFNTLNFKPWGPSRACVQAGLPLYLVIYINTRT